MRGKRAKLIRRSVALDNKGRYIPRVYRRAKLDWTKFKRSKP